MHKINKHIEIVSSSIAVLSSMSLVSRNAIRTVLSKHYSNVDITIVDNLSDLKSLVDKNPDLVFLGMDFLIADSNGISVKSKKVWISDYLELSNIAHTGSKSIAHKIEYDKAIAKQCMIDANIATSPFCVVGKTDFITKKNTVVTYPVFVKPTNRGGGVGIDSRSVVNNFEQLKIKTRSISDLLDEDSLVEQYLTGREFSVAILKDLDTENYDVMPIELIAQPDNAGVRILSKEVKCSNTEKAIFVKDKKIFKIVSDLAIDAFHALGARDYGRIDIRMDNFGNPQFLEANLIPSVIKGYGSFPKACLLNIGMEYEEMIIRIAKLGLSRNNNVADAMSVHYVTDDINKSSFGALLETV